MYKKVSIIMPNFNCLLYLDKAIKSVLIQKNISFELIIIDDGSTDGSCQYLEEMEKKHKQIRLIKQSNKGVVNARNRAIQQAKFKYIAFLDADDYWYPDKLEKQINYMEENENCGLTFSNYQHVDTNYNEIIDCFSYWEEFKSYLNNDFKYKKLSDPVNFLLTTNVIGTSSVIVRKSIIQQSGGFDFTLNSATDWDCWLRIALISDIAFTEEVTMDYLMRENSITSNKLKRINAMEDIIERIGSHKKVTEDSVKKANIRLQESYGEMHRENKFYLKSFKCSLFVLFEKPNKRHLKHLFFDFKQLINPFFIFNSMLRRKT
jgi:glycosyltransferase involved in cell wall biosynthesis